VCVGANAEEAGCAWGAGWPVSGLYPPAGVDVGVGVGLKLGAGRDEVGLGLPSEEDGSDDVG
jgi:hypothetical protein